MKQTEFKLKVSSDIVENISTMYATKIVHYAIGDVLTVDESTFDRLVKGEVITRYTQEGLFRFDKYNFENDVATETVTVTIDRNVRFLKQNLQKKALRDLKTV